MLKFNDSTISLTEQTKTIIEILQRTFEELEECVPPSVTASVTESVKKDLLTWRKNRGKICKYGTKMNLKIEQIKRKIEILET